MSTLLAIVAAGPLSAQTVQLDRWRVTASDTATVASDRPSPLSTWQRTLPLRRGIALWARNPTSDTIAIPGVEVWECVNIGAGCGQTLIDTIVAPGDSLLLVTLRPRQWNARYGFRWTHSWMPVGDSSESHAIYALPAWAAVRLESAAFVEYYSESAYLTPRLLEADLDGDGRRDAAVAIQDHHGRRGIVVLRAAQAGFLILGGTSERDPAGYDFGQIAAWGVAAEGTALELEWPGGRTARVRVEGDRIVLLQP